MKLHSEKRSVIQSNYNMKSKKMDISQKDAPVLMDMLRNKVYSNKPAALVREYTINAIDEHVIHNVDRPVEITVPTLSNPIMRIRDYGKGLNEQEIEDIYIMYGASTKRNDNIATGGFGIGCKCWLSYGDQYSIESYVASDDSVCKTTYSIVVGEDNIGTLTQLNKELLPSNTPTGIEISGPILTEDIKHFIAEIKKLWLSCDDAVKPKLIGGDVCVDFEYTSVEKDFFRVSPTSKAFEQGTFSPTTKASAIMGNISYPIQSTQLDLSSGERAFINTPGLYLKFELGDLSVASNREELEYNKHTIGSIERVIKGMFKNFTDSIIKNIEKYDCLFDMNKEYAKQTAEMHNEISRYIKSCLPVGVGDGTLQIDRTLGHEVISYEYKFVGGEYKLYSDREKKWLNFGSYNWLRGNLTIMVAPDTLAKSNVTRRVKNWIKINGFTKEDHILCIFGSDKQCKDPRSFIGKVIKQLACIDVNKVINLVDVDPLPSKEAVRNGMAQDHVDLFRLERSRSFSQNDCWKDAGNVSISKTSHTLYLHLSSTKAIEPHAIEKGIKNPHTTIHAMEKDQVHALIQVAERYYKHLTSDECVELEDHVKIDGYGQPYLQIDESRLYGVRKHNYKLIDAMPMTTNLYELAVRLLTREVEYQIKHNTDEFASWCNIKDAIADRHQVYEGRDCSIGTIKNYGYSNTQMSTIVYLLKYNVYMNNQVTVDVNKNIPYKDYINDRVLNHKKLRKTDKVLFKHMLYISDVDGSNKFKQLLRDLNTYNCMHLIDNIPSKSVSYNKKDVRKLIIKISKRWPLLNLLIPKLYNHLDEVHPSDLALYEISQLESESRETFNKKLLMHANSNVVSILDEIIRYIVL